MQEQPQQKVVPLLGQVPEQQAPVMQLSLVVPDCKDIKEKPHIITPNSNQAEAPGRRARLQFVLVTPCPLMAGTQCSSE